MADQLVLDLVSKGLVTDRLVLTVGYDIDNLTDPARRAKYRGRAETDRYGRQAAQVWRTATIRASDGLHLVHAPAHATRRRCCSTGLWTRKSADPAHVSWWPTASLREADAPQEARRRQFSSTCSRTTPPRRRTQEAEDELHSARERRLQQAALAIKSKYGKNALLKGMNLEERRDCHRAKRKNRRA